MSIFFSPSKLGFYMSKYKTIHSVWPDDLVTITEEEHKEMLKQLTSTTHNVILSKDEDGKPIVVPYATSDDVRIMEIQSTRATLLTEADIAILKLQDSQILQLDEDATIRTKLKSWVIYRQQLRDITEVSGYPWSNTDIPWPEKPEM
jgi:hypothetical protein